ncbi:peptide deformylase 1A, chloroplastic/mitochondrial [Tanacetum coccineum]
MFPLTKSQFNTVFITHTRGFSSGSTNGAEEDWLGENLFCTPIPFILMLFLFLFALFPSEEKKLPSIVNVGDPILHQPARELYPEEIGSQRIQKTIDDMIKVMRIERVASLSAPKIGVPIKIIVLEDTKLYMSPSPNEVNEKQERQPSDLLYVNPPSKPRYCEPKTENHELPDNTVFRRMCMSKWPPSNGEKVPKGTGHRVGSK